MNHENSWKPPSPIDLMRLIPAGFDSNVELPELDDHGMQVMKGDDDWYCRYCDELLEECICDED